MKLQLLKNIFLLGILIQFTMNCTAQTNKNDSFSFIAFGDMPYVLPQDYARFERLIQTVNQQKSVFSVHVGDIKSGSTICSEEYYNKIYNYFLQFENPFIYTPGDNEWTDCNRKDAGAYSPEERLEVVRKTFFRDHNSYGKNKLALTSQSLNPSFTKFVENNRWTLGNIAFATIHLVGTNNNFVIDSKNHNQEFYERNEANLAWLDEVFKEAKAKNNLGLVLFTQADMFNGDKGTLGFESILKKLAELTQDFKKPVLLINGDSHQFVINKPLKDKATKATLMNFTRLQVFGETDIHAVKISVDPNSSQLFLFEQLLIQGN